MHFFPGVAWDAWPDLPWDLTRGCIALIDQRNAGG